MAFQSLWRLIIFVILLSINIDALRYRSVRQAGVCSNPNGNSCNFVTCENGGVCIEDPTTVDCFKCQCTPGYTGKVCDTSIVILPPTCNPGCQNGGVCNVNICICPAGFTGTYCETRDYCLPINPCQNGGRCVSNGANYVCDCTGTGYTGTICTQPTIIDPCTSSPCQNGGQCSWNGQTMSCLCVNGYAGTFCQIAPVPCAAAPCENGGKCELITGNTYGCACPQDFTGTRCETSIIATHPCVTMPALCQNGGVCTINELGYLCKCAAGWSGTNCQIRETITSCNPDPCGAHGTCEQATLSSGSIIAYCHCASQWTGKYCDVNIYETCPAGYCLSGGICRMNGNIPYCDCPPLYTGQRCETPVGALTTTSTVGPGIILCPSNLCQNGGTCYSIGSGFVCQCPPNWTGAVCQIAQTVTITSTLTTPSYGITCANQPCRNGATCYDSGNSYYCNCGSNNMYTGKNCETFLPPTTNCPLNCAPGFCMLSGSSITPYVCMCGDTMKLYNCI